MKFILDLHISGKAVGRPLAEAGHDVRATDAERKIFDRMKDEDLLALAAEDGRVLVTRNVRDFPAIAGRWHVEGRRHAGIIMIPSSIEHREFGAIVAGVEELLAGTTQPDWQNRFRWMRRVS